MNKVKELTQFEFIEKVYNYLLNPDSWIYLGKIPAIITFYNPKDDNKDLFASLNKIAEKSDGKYYVYKINTEADKEFSSIFVEDNCTPITYFCAMKGNPTITEGDVTYEHLKDIINKYLLPKY